MIMIRVLFLLFAMFTMVEVSADTKPTVYIVATGGTIAGSGTSNVTSSYKPGVLSIESILESVKGVDQIANIKTSQFLNIASQNMSGEQLLKLANYIEELLQRDDVSGVVITHGTDTMEETAYFLSLVVESSKPIVLVGAMRPSSGLGADGPANLYAAVATAVDPESMDRGVLVVMNDQIFAAEDVEKSHTQSVAAFAAPNGSVIGVIANGQPIYQQPERTLKSVMITPKSMPKVAVLYGHIDSDPSLVDFLVVQGNKGIVYAGTGHGNMNDATLEALSRAAKKGVVVVRASRIYSGLVTSDGEVDDAAYGFTSSGALNPAKARILLSLALSASGNNSKMAIEIFDELK